MDGFAEWVAVFEESAAERAMAGDPDWRRRAVLPAAIVRSVQRFQVGESGDGANLLAKAETQGPDRYPVAAKLFVAEEQNHARLLALLLASAGAPTLRAHWSDAAFVRLRRALGLRLELMVLMIAEVVALGYYRALRDGTDDPLLTDVAGRILDDEQRHVPFHCQRLRLGFASMPSASRRATAAGWRLLFAGALVAVVADHGSALRALGVTRRSFAGRVFKLFNAAVAEALREPKKADGELGDRRWRPNPTRQ